MQNIRPDSRSFDAVRDMNMSGGNLSNKNTVTCYGSSYVSLGGTRVVAGVTLIALEVPYTAHLQASPSSCPSIDPFSPPPFTAFLISSKLPPPSSYPIESFFMLNLYAP